MGIPENRIGVLQKIIARFKEHNISDNWIIAGGLAHLTHGLQVSTSDIDILTTTDGAFGMYEALKDCCIQEMEVCGNEKFHSAFGKFEIDKVLIEIAGDLIIKGDFNYRLNITDEVIKCCKVVECANYPIYFEPLEESIIADSLLGRSPRIQVLVETLKQRGANFAYIGSLSRSTIIRSSFVLCICPLSGRFQGGNLWLLQIEQKGYYLLIQKCAFPGQLLLMNVRNMKEIVHLIKKQLMLAFWQLPAMQWQKDTRLRFWICRINQMTEII
ncbi:hypothetical protein ES707_15996 [subsurface metagenome]